MSQGCATWRDDLAAYVIGALDSEERAAMRRHLAACPTCRTEYEDFLHLRLAHNQAARPDTGRCAVSQRGDDASAPMT